MSIEGKTTGLTPNQFIGFMLVAQPKDTTPQTYGISLGSFEPTDSLAKYHDRCQNSIMHSSQVPKTKVQVSCILNIIILFFNPRTKKGIL